MYNRILCFLMLLLIVSHVYSQNDEAVLMKVGNSEITVSEFKYIYEKNNGDKADYSKGSVKDYLDLYTKFKLKVQLAKELQLDTIAELKSELAGYRKQLASSYLIDKEVTETLLNELYNRMDYDVEFSHIFIPVSKFATHDELEKAKIRLLDAKSKIIGGMSFVEAAKEYSLDTNTADEGGKMGYFTAKMPSGYYELESALYTLPNGEISDVIETDAGVHLIKVTNKRPARGVIEVSQILFELHEKALADSVYHALLEGANFEDMVKLYSKDIHTNKNGGKVQPFGIRTYFGNFEDAAFGLANDGDFSRPILTKSGWHIIRRDRKFEKDSYEVFVKKMRPELSKDTRFNAAKLKLVESIKTSAGFSESKGVLENYASNLGEEFYTYRWTPTEVSHDEKLFTLAEEHSYMLSDFQEYCRKNTRIRLRYDKSKPVNQTLNELYKEFVNEMALNYEEELLEEKYPDFKSLMREYEEGILLFEVTKMFVWDKANQDSLGLQRFYEDSISKYVWPAQYFVAEATIAGVPEKNAKKIFKYAIKNDLNKTANKYNTKSNIFTYKEVQYDADNEKIVGLNKKKGAYTDLITEDNGASYNFKKLLESIPSRAKTLNEARGYVVADYQDYLEKNWIDDLKKEYRVVVYPEVLNSLNK